MKLVIYILLSLTTFPIFADGYVVDPEPAILEVRYERTEINDTNNRASKFRKEEMLLRIGKTKSVFCSVKRLWTDSMQRIDDAGYWRVFDAAWEKYKGAAYNVVCGRTMSYLYKNIPDGKITEHDFFDATPWGYSEDWEKPVWEISDESKEILGYQCFKATADYRGRRWTAWFAPEIPIQEGPWKLCGLPGLILEAYDEKRDYSFEAKGLIQDETLQVGIMNYRQRSDRIIVKRDTFFKNWYRYKHSDFASKISAMTGGKVNPGKINMNNQYDKEETNYPHNL